MNPLIWKRELPTQPGWYWLRELEHFTQQKEVRVVKLRNYVGELAVENSTIKGWKEKSEWAGPIPEPQEAKTIIKQKKQT